MIRQATPAGVSAPDEAGRAEFAYPGAELEAMEFADNYHRWIFDIFKPFLGQHLVEVGAGLGSFSQLILAHHNCQTLSLVEPSNEMYEELAVNAKQWSTNTQVITYHGTFPEAAPLIQAGVADSIIYINVLEHIAADEEELEKIHSTLCNGGRAFLFVPALSWLYGVFDERVGHVRRYRKQELEEKLARAGFRTVTSTYFDLPGIVPWWLKYCLLRSASMDPGAVKLYDRFIVPAARRIESIIPPPLGKNLIIVAEKR
ncbi:MAG TPA: methyltransferase domain-containing protein [Pyrinomonadaceae bacterium]|jgi:SAM-dependent methyltransferase|nr:methyltransferase domain-containing protein [Pyrinomonadaceae bacterium]